MTNQIRLSVLGIAVAMNLAALAALQVAMVRGADRAVAERAVEHVVVTASRLELPEAQALVPCPTASAAL